VDIYPTLVALAGGKMPASQVFDGESLVPLLRDPKATLTRDAIFQHFPGYLGAGADSWRTTPVSVIQSGEWKLMEFLEDGRLELYNLKDDLSEKKNLASTEPGRTKALHARLVAWRESVKAPMPTANKSASAAEPEKKKKGGKRKKAQEKV
jgi:arylsulfatase A-like enzyme